MCVAVVVPAGQRLTEEQLRAMHAANPDSWGFAFWAKHPEHVNTVFPGYVVTRKDTTNADDMVKNYFEHLDSKHALERDSKPHLAHFRIRTCGKTDVKNAHPFHIKGGVLIHNGHISGGGNAEYSDTFHFARAFNDHIPDDLTEQQIEYMSKLIGSYNKVAVLHSSGSTTIFNKSAGTVLPNGIWVSNTYWQNRYNMPF